MKQTIFYTLGFTALLFNIIHYHNKENQKPTASEATQEPLQKMDPLFKAEDGNTLKPNNNIELPNEDKQIQIINNEFHHLASLKGHLNKNAIREQKLAELANNPENIAIAQRSLLDLDWVMKNFGDNQAEARIYSIELLKTRASQGDNEPLLDTGKQLSALLSRDKSEWIKGREHDLRDIMGAFIQIKGREFIINNPKILLETFNYNKNIETIFQKTVFSYLTKSSFDEEVAKAFMPFWS